MAFINPTPGVAAREIVVELDIYDTTLNPNCTVTSSNVTLSSNKITVPAITKITINNSAGTYEWAQLDNKAKQVVTTVSTNSLTTDVVVDAETFFGNTSLTANSAVYYGISKLANNKQKVAFKVRMAPDANATGAGYTYGGVGYITGIALSASADQPVWQTPLTIAVSGDYVVETGAAL